MWEIQKDPEKYFWWQIFVLKDCIGDYELTNTLNLWKTYPLTNF